ncbi:MAG: peptidase C69 [Candidatus Lokiarchaeota archaeon]|nr:peptidase C69 [Candidatus Lokiarchaeota archaeon]
MCDTYVSFNNNNTVVFGKNSDRIEKEAQILTYSPRMKHSLDEELNCTHISIPQVSETAAVILSQPYWIWGAEMGANEYGVVIGNEAVATKEPLEERGLLGMDLLRLGLERGKTAKGALDIITLLLETYGQGGAHNEKGLNYHNSCIIVDPKEAYVLEMAGRWWIVEKVDKYRSISNNISIRGKGDMRRDGIIQHAIEEGYCKNEDDFDFKLIFSPSPLPEEFPPDTRDGCSLNQLSNNRGEVSPENMMNFLREHEVGICMHSRNNQSTGSQVSLLRSKGKKNIHWFTGSTIPCLSIFKPYIFPAEGFIFTAEHPGPFTEIDETWFWTRHSKFIKPYKKKPNRENPDRDKYQNQLRNIEKGLIDTVNKVLSDEDKISKDTFIQKIREINSVGWKKSEEKIK